MHADGFGHQGERASRRRRRDAQRLPLPVPGRRPGRPRSAPGDHRNDRARRGLPGWPGRQLLEERKRDLRAMARGETLRAANEEWGARPPVRGMEGGCGAGAQLIVRYLYHWTGNNGCRDQCRRMTRTTIGLCSKFGSDRVCRNHHRNAIKIYRRRAMVRYLAPLFCGVLLLVGWSATEANAQAAKAQAHVTAAKAAAYEPGHDFTAIFALCAEPNPNPPAAAPAVAPAAAAPATRTIPPRSQWYIEPQKVF